MKAKEIHLQKQIGEQVNKLTELIQQSEYTAGIIIIETLKESEGTLYRFIQDTAPVGDKKTVVTSSNVINEAMTSKSNPRKKRKIYYHIKINVK